MSDEIPIIGHIDDPDLMSKLEDAFRDNDCNMNRSRPYSGQSWTTSGGRGRQQVSGLTMRDVRDCFVRAACLAAGHTNAALYEEATKGERARLNTDSLYELDWSKIDPQAVAQNMTCEIERLMGIFPNVEDGK